MAANSKRSLVAVPASGIEREQVEWLLPDRVPIGLVTVIAGVGGLGKSQWTCLLAAQLSRGDLEGNPGATLLATAEDSPKTTVIPRLEALQADMSQVHFLKIQSEDGEDGIVIPDDLDALEEMVRSLSARLLIIDPLVAHLPISIDSHKDQSVRRALAPLYRLAEATDCAVVTLLHLNKKEGLDPLMRIGASVAFSNAARSVLLLARDPDDPDGTTGNRRVLAHIKCNVGPLAASLLYEVAPILLPATKNLPAAPTSRLQLLGESNHNGYSLVSTDSEDDRTVREEACDLLRDLLSDGERHPAALIIAEGERIGVEARALRRALVRIGGKKEKAGFRGGWEWWIPLVSTKGPV